MICFDIETLPTGTVKDEDITVPKNYKDPEKIKEYIEKKKDEVFKKRALSYTDSKVICISYSFGNSIFSSYGDNEEKVVREFWENVEKAVPHKDLYTLEWVGFNILKFDLPILFLRACKYNIENMRIFFPTGTRVIDLMKIATYNVYGEFVSMDKLCEFFGIEGKLMDGSQVYDTWLKDKDKIRRYCEDDVKKVMRLYKILKK